MSTETGTPNIIAASIPDPVDRAIAVPIVPPGPTARPATGPMAAVPSQINSSWAPMIRPCFKSPKIRPTKAPVTTGSRTFASPIQ